MKRQQGSRTPGGSARTRRLRSGSAWVIALGLLAACSSGDTPASSRAPSRLPGGTFTPTGGGGTAAAQSGSDGFGNGPGSVAGSSPSVTPGGLGNDGACADAMIHTSTNEPDILFVVDGSGSMCAPFGGATRWNALRTALLDPTNGLIYKLQQTVDFGMLLYDGTIDLVLALSAVGGSSNPDCALNYASMKAEGMCPQLIQVPVALNNAMAIDQAFPTVELGGSTPTDRAMNTAVDQMIAAHVNNPDVKPHPQYIVLATDGQPNDICVDGAGGDGSPQKAGVIAAVDRAAMANITTFVISLAGNDPGLQAHLDEVAKHGEPDNPMAHTFNPTSPEDLVGALAAIVGGAVGCDIFLTGMISAGANECRGNVQINGVKLPCCKAAATGGMMCDDVPTDPVNGWQLQDKSTIRLVGNACTDFLTNPDGLLTAWFPCDVLVQ